MPPIFVVLLCLFSILCYTCQFFFNKLFSVSYPGDASATTPVYATVFGLIVGFSTMLCSGGLSMPSRITLIFGLADGLTLFLYNLGMIRAAQTGPYSIQSVIMLFGCVLLPMLFCTFFWGERLKWLQLVGIALVLCSFVLLNLKGFKLAGVKKGFFGWVALLFFTNGIYSIILDAQQRLMLKTQRNEMIVVTFLTVGLISLVYLLISQKRAALKAFRMGKKSLIFLLISSVAASVAVNTLVILLGQVKAAVLFAVQNSGVLVMSVLLSAVCLHEKLERHLIFGILVGLLGILALSV